MNYINYIYKLFIPSNEVNSSDVNSTIALEDFVKLSTKPFDNKKFISSVRGMKSSNLSRVTPTTSNNLFTIQEDQPFDKNSFIREIRGETHPTSSRVSPNDLFIIPEEEKEEDQPIKQNIDKQLFNNEVLTTGAHAEPPLEISKEPLAIDIESLTQEEQISLINNRLEDLPLLPYQVIDLIINCRESLPLPVLDWFLRENIWSLKNMKERDNLGKTAFYKVAEQITLAKTPEEFQFYRSIWNYLLKYDVRSVEIPTLEGENPIHILLNKLIECKSMETCKSLKEIVGVLLFQAKGKYIDLINQGRLHSSTEETRQIFNDLYQIIEDLTMLKFGFDPYMSPNR